MTRQHRRAKTVFRFIAIAQIIMLVMGSFQPMTAFAWANEHNTTIHEDNTDVNQVDSNSTADQEEVGAESSSADEPAASCGLTDETDTTSDVDSGDESDAAPEATATWSDSTNATTTSTGSTNATSTLSGGGNATTTAFGVGGGEDRANATTTATTTVSAQGGSTNSSGSAILPVVMGGGGSASSASFGGSSGGSTTAVTSLGLGTTTTLGTCGPLLHKYLRLGFKNDVSEVMKLQTFLNKEMGTTIPVTGFFGMQTYKAVGDFQVKYWREVLSPWVPFGLQTDHTPTEYVYKTTEWKINAIYCPSLTVPMPLLP